MHSLCLFWCSSFTSAYCPYWLISYYYLLPIDRKSTRLNSSHVRISYAVFCLKKKIRARHRMLFVCLFRSVFAAFPFHFGGLVCLALIAIRQLAIARDITTRCSRPLPLHPHSY